MSEFKHERFGGISEEDITHGFVTLKLTPKLHYNRFNNKQITSSSPQQNKPIVCHDPQNNVIASLADLIGSGGHVAAAHTPVTGSGNADGAS